MTTDAWILPEGVEEVLPPRAARMEALRRRLLDLFSSWGYELVVPPFIEYLDSLLTGMGRDLDLQTFKLIDQLSGRSMGVRADMTPQVARIDARHLRDRHPARLCYIGTVLHTLPGGLSRGRSPVQVGAELYGHGDVQSDCEILCLMVECLRRAGIDEVHLDLGHVGIFRGLAHAARVDGETESVLHEALQRKARPEIEELLGRLPGAGDAASMILALTDLNGDEETLEAAARELAGAPADVLEGVSALGRLAGEVRARVPDVPLHFDLAELRGYRYHTGVVFAAFVPGHGAEVARGGRYDDIGSAFGHPRPATGFSTDLNRLAELAGDDPGACVAPPAVLAPWSTDAELARLVADLRAAGERVVFELPGSPPEGASRGCARRIARVAGAWRIEPIDPIDD